MTLKKILSKKNIQLFNKYILISFFGYGFVFSSLYIMIDLLGINKSISFLIVYGISYIILYSIQLRFLFKTEHNKKRLLKFIGSLIFFYLLANLFYNIGIQLEIQYLISTCLTIAILTPLRFIVSKQFVFK